MTIRIMRDDEQSSIANALMTARDVYKRLGNEAAEAGYARLAKQFQRQVIEAERLAGMIQEFDWRGASEPSTIDQLDIDMERIEQAARARP
jgi:hypothetical protein